MSSNRDKLWLDAWYQNKKWVYCLLPIELLFRVLAWFRRQWLERFKQCTLNTPVIVVGNISVGGTGKTPLIIEMVKHLQKSGYQVGVVSRGYGSKAPKYPYIVRKESTVKEAGDEPLNILHATGCQVCIDADRVAAATLLEKNGCDILLSDDGLQHYRLDRSIEIIVIDAERGLGNSHCLPVGPLREPESRLATADFIIANQTSLVKKSNIVLPHFTMHLQPRAWHKVKSLECLPLATITEGTKVHAVAGIGNPQRFFNTLESLNLQPLCHVYRDHHDFTIADFNFKEKFPVVMTSKDAIKCKNIAEDHWFSLDVRAVVDKRFWFELDKAILAFIK